MGAHDHEEHGHRGGKGPRGGRGRGGPRGGFPGGGGPFGPFGPPFRRGGRARRGDVRLAILRLVAEEPRNGYAIMQAIEERTDGVWRPSPGSVYPALSQLEDEGLIRVEQIDGGKLFHLTDAGQAHVDERAGEPAPWDAVNENVDEGAFALFRQMRSIGMAIGQLAHEGDAKQIAEARKILDSTRKALYRLLAQDEDEAPAADDDVTDA